MEEVTDYQQMPRVVSDQQVNWMHVDIATGSQVEYTHTAPLTDLSQEPDEVYGQ